MAEYIFFISIFLILYIYLGYPLTIVILAFLFNRKVHKESIFPFVTVLISAYNEEDVILDTIKNKLEQDYPHDRLEIIVVSDGSTDRTDEIVANLRNPCVRLIHQYPRAGKTSALNHGVAQARGEIIVFSDANSIYAPNALRMLVSNFADPKVGYVTGRMIYGNSEGSTVGNGCSLYMKYENFLRSFETKIRSVVGVDGGIDAIRKTLYQPMRPDQLPDFVLPLKVIEMGFRVVYEPEAVLNESSLKTTADEYKMRVRVSLRALWALWDMRHFLGFSRSIIFAWQLWWHKVLRYICFVFLIAAYVSNLVIWSKADFYKIFFVLQNILYFGSVAFIFLQKFGYSLKLLYLPHYFTILNGAAAHAFLKFIIGKKQVIWTPRKG